MNFDTNPIINPYSRELALQMKIGECRPVRYSEVEGSPNGEYLEFVARENDLVIKSLPDGRHASFSMGILEGNVPSSITLAWIFIEFRGKEVNLYSKPFNLAHPVMRRDLTILSNQPNYEVVFCGDTVNRAVQFESRAFKDQLQKFLLSTPNLKWNEIDHFQTLQNISARIAPSQLLQRFRENSGKLRFDQIN